MNDYTPDNDADEYSTARDPERDPEERLGMTSSGPYLLYSVQHPSTRWIESDVVLELETWL